MFYKIGFLFFVLISFITSEVMMKSKIEQQARSQARSNLKMIQYCVNKDLESIKNPSDKQIGETIEKCGRYSLMSKTGDIFAFKRNNLKFVYDASSDCFIPGGKFFDKKLEELFYDPKSAESLKQEMLKGFDSIYGDNKSWRFRKDSDEWIEWVYLPSTHKGFDDKKVNGVVMPNQIILGQGIVKEEYMKRYHYVFLTYHIILFIILMFISVRILLFEKLEKNLLLKNICVNCDVKKRLEEVTKKQEKCHGCRERDDKARCDECPLKKE